MGSDFTRSSHKSYDVSFTPGSVTPLGPGEKYEPIEPQFHLTLARLVKEYAMELGGSPLGDLPQGYAALIEQFNDALMVAAYDTMHAYFEQLANPPMVWTP